MIVVYFENHIICEIYCDVSLVTKMGCRLLIAFIEHFNTQLMTAFYISLLPTYTYPMCPQSCLHCRYLVAASNGGHSLPLFVSEMSPTSATNFSQQQFTTTESQYFSNSLSN
jgi:hypothetical protein